MMEFLLESLVRGYQHSVTLSILTACCSSSVAGVFFPRGGAGGEGLWNLFQEQNLTARTTLFLYRRTLLYQNRCIFSAWFHLTLEKFREDIFLGCISSPQNSTASMQNPDSLLTGTHIASMNTFWTGPFWWLFGFFFFLVQVRRQVKGVKSYLLWWTTWLSEHGPSSKGKSC